MGITATQPGGWVLYSSPFLIARWVWGLLGAVLLGDTLRNLLVVLTFARQDLVDRYSGSIFGGVWSLLMPLVNILIYTLVFSKIMGARLSMAGMPETGYGYSLYLVSGLLAWLCFSGTVTRMTSVYREKAGIIAKVNINLQLLPLYLLISETVIFLVSLLLFVGFIYWIDHSLSYHVLWLPVIFMLQQGIAYALGLLFANLSIFIQDVRELVSIVFNIWFWLTPIIYVIDILPEPWGDYLKFNPAYYVISAYRDVILLHQHPDMTVLLGTAVTMVGLVGVALLFSRRVEQDVRDFI